MPLVYRVMKPDGDGLPIIEQSSNGLGVRPGIDVDVDPQNNAIANGKGMSVAPSWRVLPIFRIPKRLKDKVLGARGSDATCCFKCGDGPFQEGAFAVGLVLAPDSPKHGCVAPAQTVPLAHYQKDLATTRSGWAIDED